MCVPTAEENSAPGQQESRAQSSSEVQQHDERPAALQLRPPPDSYGSSVEGAIFNFTNCIVGAGAIGLGGAFADSGGLISVITIILFAILTKLSLDLVVQMSVENLQPLEGDSTGREMRSASYEELGLKAFGQPGRIAVMLSKFLYSFGCLVAYIIVVKDNFAPALQHLIYGSTGHHDAWFNKFLLQPNAEDVVTFLLGIFVILPLCLLRDMTPLSKLGAASIASMILIVFIVGYIYVAEPGVRRRGESNYENWVRIRPGYIESLGTFVFTFVSQHTVNLTFESLKPEIRTVDSWKKVSSTSLFIASAISLTIGVIVYATFWESTQSDLFAMYPPMRKVDFAKILLCITMLLTFPLPFFACRELLIVSIIRPLTRTERDDNIVHLSGGQSMDRLESADMQEPLLTEDERRRNHDISSTAEAQHDNDPESTSVIFDDPRDGGGMLCRKLSRVSVIIPGEEKQLSLPFHLGLSISLWAVTTVLAIEAPNLGDILDLVGAASGTSMAFILPGLLSLKLQGYTTLGLVILLIGGAIGVIGTGFSLRKLVIDIES